MRSLLPKVLAAFVCVSVGVNLSDAGKTSEYQISLAVDNAFSFYQIWKDREILLPGNACGKRKKVLAERFVGRRLDIRKM